MPAIQIEPDQLLHAALQMSRPEIEQFVRKLVALKIREETPGLSERETELMLNINQALPAKLQQRLNVLIEKRRAETISASELRELKKLTDQVENFDATRLESLIELAHLRRMPLRKLIKQLGLKPVSHD
jgi:hypothetical protein